MKGILMCGEMAQAAYEERKTETRRMIKPQPFSIAGDMLGQANFYPIWEEGDFADCSPIKPKYSIGETVYVKEAWEIEDCGCRVSLDKAVWAGGWLIDRVRYGACHELAIGFSSRSSLFMPAWAARTFLEITGVKVERVQDITEEGAIAEIGQMDACVVEAEYAAFERPHRQVYRDLWNRLHPKPGERWEDNPWVFVYQFKKVGGRGR